MTLSLKAGIDPTEYWSLRLISRHVEATNFFDSTDFSTGLPADGDLYTENHRDYGHLQSKISLLEGRWEHIVGGGYTATESDNFSDGMEMDSTQGRRYELDYQTNYFFKAPASGDIRQAVTFAADYEKEGFTQRGAATAFGDPNQERSIHSMGLIGEFRLSSEQNWSFSTSLRYDSNSDFQDDTTFRLSGSYRTGFWGTQLRAAYGTGSKNPTFTERFGYFAESATPFIGNPDLEPERSEGWEAGFDKYLWQDQGKLAVTYFDERLKNEINDFTFNVSEGFFTAVNVDGISKRKGIEIAGQMALAQAFTVKGIDLPPIIRSISGEGFSCKIDPGGPKSEEQTLRRRKNHSHTQRA